MIIKKKKMKISHLRIEKKQKFLFENNSIKIKKNIQN